MRGIIYAVSTDGVIGVAGTIPWHYAGDMRRFKRMTLGSTIVMGRATFESLGRALPGRRNIVVTSRAGASGGASGIECVRTIDEALALAGSGDLWFIGGARIYAEAMKYADVIDVVYVPDRVGTVGAVRAPTIDDRLFEAGPLLAHEDDPLLTRRIYTRKTG